MNLTVSQPALSSALASVARAVSPRSTLPVLANVLLVAKDGQLQISATNLSIGITRTIGAAIIKPGAITIPARLLSELIGSLPPNPVELSLNENTLTLTVKSGTNKTNVKGIDAAEFPPMPEAGEGQPLDPDTFIKAVGRVIFAASTDEARPVLQGVRFTRESDCIGIAATDGYRVATATIPGAIIGAAIIPALALAEVVKLAKGSDLSFRIDEARATFMGDGWLLTTQLIDGAFPDVKRIMPQSFKTTVTVDAPAISKACKQAEIMAREGNGIVRLKIGAGLIELTGQSEELGDAEIIIPALLDGPEMTIAFNVKFLREALDAAGPTVTLKANDHKSPAQVTAPGDNDWQCVVMPMHLG